MIIKLRRTLVPAAVALGLVGSFFLPNLVAGVTDARKLDSITVIDAQSISFNADLEFNLPERLSLTASSKTELLALTTGQTMGEDTAAARAVRELARFLRGGPYGFDVNDYAAENGTTAFIIDSENPSANMVVWEFTLTDRLENEVIITIDDETGVILKLIYRQGRTPAILGTAAEVTEQQDTDYNSLASRLCEMMEAYYGIPITFGDYTLGNNLAYYRADMHTGSSAIPVPMYGVVRESGFTMNEKH